MNPLHRLARVAVVLTLLTLPLLLPAPALAQGQNSLQEREAAWSVWHQSSDAIWMKWRAELLPDKVRQGVQEDMSRFPAQLVQAGVLPAGDDHAWTEGCAAFEGALVHATHEIASPMGVEGWREWRAVHRVMCGPIAHEHALLASAFSRMVPDLLPAPATLSWASLVLEELPEEDWDCMASQVPAALRRGLDRHEGLKWVARQCRLEPSLVFGDAQRCNGCTSHPRQPRRPTIQTWAYR